MSDLKFLVSSLAGKTHLQSPNPLPRARLLEAQENQCVQVDSYVVQPVRKLVGLGFCSQKLP